MSSVLSALVLLRSRVQARYQFAKIRFRELVAVGDMETALRYFEAAVRLERLSDFLEAQIKEESDR